MRFAQLLPAFLSLAVPATAGELLFSQPIDCDLGTTCFIQQYVDHDSGPGAQDFTCGALSYDNHKGTDFGLPSFNAMRGGVDVLAAAPGIVRGLRDGMPDTGFSQETAAQIEGKDCGNGVVIDHGDGWQTQYCHMKRGTITVAKGQRVGSGTILGQVGFSGRTQFPHLHLSVRKNGKVVDPFDPDGQITCGPPERITLWQSPPQYAAGGLLSAGFSTDIPTYTAVKDGTAGNTILSLDAPALVVWGYAFGGQAGDTLRIEIRAPDGLWLVKTVDLNKPQAQFFRATGKRRPAQGFTPGQYQGYIALIRKDRVIDEIYTKTVLR